MTFKFIILILAASVYTLLRYVVFGPVAPEHIPVYLLNKSLSMTSAVCLFLTSYGYIRDNLEKIRFWGRNSFNTAFIHILLSLAILNREYFPKFFGPEKMNLTGELSILSGICAAFLFYIGRRKWCEAGRAVLFPALLALFLGAHLFAMGWAGWITPSKWHGYLPPISLISFIFAVSSLILFVISTHRRGN